MAKRKLTNAKSSTKGKNGPNKMTSVKIKKILEHVSTEDFIKFRNQDIKTITSSIATTTAPNIFDKCMKAPKVNSISKKDKMRFKKQRFLNKIDIISSEMKKGLLKKRNKKLKDTQHKPEKSALLFNDIALEHKITTKETKEICNTIIKKVKIPLEGSKANTAIDSKDLVSSCKPIKSSKKPKKATIFKKAKKNSNKNRQRNFINGLNAYKKQMKKEEFVEDPIKAISECVNAYVRKENVV